MKNRSRLDLKFMINPLMLGILFLFSFFKAQAQTGSTLYHDEKVKVTFKTFDNQYGYILEEYASMYGGTLVKYTIRNGEMILEELQQDVVIDSMLFEEFSSYHEDSILLQLTYRVLEFESTTVTDSKITYVINDSLQYAVGERFPDDELHRAIAPKVKTPYNLKVYSGDECMGSFTVNGSNDIQIRIVLLSSRYLDEIDLNTVIPNVIDFEGKRLKLKFIPFIFE